MKQGSRSRDESGAVAIMVGLMAVMLMSVAALTVDLSSAFVQKRDIQKKADFSALAGSAGDDLPMTAAGGTCVSGPNSWAAAKATDQAIIDTAAYLNTTPDYSGSAAVKPADLVDCNFANGEADYGMWSAPSATGVRSFTPNKNQLSVISQSRRVNFGFAQVMGPRFKSVNVNGQATVELKTKLQNTLPLYAFTGCDYGQQTIAQPTNGQASSGINLSHSGTTDGNNGTITATSLSTNPYVSNPPTVVLNSTGSTITITGTKLDTVTSVGFFQSAATNPPEPVQVLKASFTSQSPTSITLPVPTAVSTVQDSWFVRVYGPDGNKVKWTPVTDKNNSNSNSNLVALLLIVGNATLSCTQGSSDGNFGTLLLSRTGDPNTGGQVGDIARNIALGLQHGLAPYPQANWTPPGYTCVDGQDGVAHVWPYDGTNCVGTKTGLDSDAAEQGFITGIDGKPGLLGNVAAGTGCHPNGLPDTIVVDSRTINNDTLSCFFTNDTTTVGDVSSATYAGPAVISQTIYKSSRFVLVPVLGRQPATGSNSTYEIVDFRPGFITDQPPTATRTSPVTPDNGITWSSSTGNSKLQSVKVTFLNAKALPDPPLDPNGIYIPYVGSGKKSALLVN